jgi:MmyB-like transcription regulator ligand binding domain
VFFDNQRTAPGTSVPWTVGEGHDRFLRTEQGWRLVARSWTSLFERPGPPRAEGASSGARTSLDGRALPPHRAQAPPRLGRRRLHLTYEVLDLPADRGLSLVVYSAEPGSASQDALKLLASWAATLD